MGLPPSPLSTGAMLSEPYFFCHFDTKRDAKQEINKTINNVNHLGGGGGGVRHWKIYGIAYQANHKQVARVKKEKMR